MLEIWSQHTRISNLLKIRSKSDTNIVFFVCVQSPLSPLSPSKKIIKILKRFYFEISRIFTILILKILIYIFLVDLLSDEWCTVELYNMRDQKHHPGKVNVSKLSNIRSFTFVHSSEMDAHSVRPWTNICMSAIS